MRFCQSLQRAFFLALAGIAPLVSAQAEIADAIYSDGEILTMRGQSPEYVEALTVKDGKILAVGRKADVLQAVGPATRQVDLAGHTLLPGFIDTHGHMVYFGKNLVDADLFGCEDIPQVLERMKHQAARVPAGGWVVGFGYQAKALKEKRVPTREELDTISRDLPVLIVDSSGHQGAGNSHLFAAAGITAETPDPADLQNPFPPGMNQILATPQNGSAAKPSDPGQAAYPSKTAPAAAPAQAPARMASPSKIQPIPRQAMVSPSDSLPTSNPVSPYGTGTLDPNTKSLPATTAPALGRGASTGAMMSRNGAGAMNPTPSKSQPNDYVDAAGRPYRTQPVPPSKVSPAGTVPGWAVPKNYRSATYPPTPSDLATRATRKTTPPAAPANTIPPTPW